MEITFEKIFILALICLGLLALRYMLVSSSLSRSRKRSQYLSQVLDEETKRVEQRLADESKKREKIIEMISSLAKDKPQMFASTMNKILTDKSKKTD
ncbi:MAG: hypothetical protein GY863_07470 [bacterium]|nr:hypothetical protein [bacterium]